MPHVTAPELYGDERLPGRFWSRVYPDPITGCWLWAGGLNDKGYGRWQPRRGLQEFVHRAVVRAFRGKPERGLHVDHLCRVRWCCNPDHLEVVTPRENQRRGRSPWSYNARKTQCVRGHEFTSGNTYWEEGAYAGAPKKRRCRECGRLRKREKYGHEGIAARLRTHCPKGHRYAGDNLIISRGRRYCRSCRNARRRRRYAELRAQAVA